MSGKDRWLLPEGIEEVLPADAWRQERMRRRVLDLFRSWGYELVRPPMIEYLDSLLTGLGQDLDLQTFKITDQLSGRMMGIRPDMTPQAARIDAHYLKREGPARLCYLAPVLRTRPDEFAGSREPLQLGAELFGHSGPESDVEILSLMVTTLDLLGLKTLHIDLGHVGVFRGLAAEAGLDAAQEAEVFSALQRKARSDIETLLQAWQVGAAQKARLLALVELNGDDAVLPQAEALFAEASEPVRKALADLRAVFELARRQRPGLSLNFDLAELSGYGYHTGVVFSAFVPGHGRAVAKGGRYDGIGRAFGRDRAATGFSSDLRQLLGLVPAAAEPAQGICAHYEDDPGLLAEIERLRESGERVVVRLPGVSVSAADVGCDRELVRRDGAWMVNKV